MTKAVAVVLSLLGFLVAPCFAQNTNSGDIRGTVTDATGAVLPGVTVTILDVDKGVTKTVVTNGSGLYDTGSIVPDSYTLTFSKNGFNRLVRGPITVQIGIIGVDAQMAVGSATQTVDVTTDVPLLETESAAVSTSIDQETMVNLPQTGGANWTSFMILNPGTSGKSSNQSNPGEDGASVNGNLPFNSVLTDGATVTLPASQNADYAIFETVSQVEVDSNAFSAEYGLGGVIYNQITKGGTNKYHGVGYEYLENNDMNAAPYAFGAARKVPILRYNNFGGSFSGPVPKVKGMFFYFDYDRTNKFGGSSNGFLSVPTTAMLGGDFTGQPTIYDPTTQVVSSGTVTRHSFASEYGNGNKIPAGMIDTVAKALQAYFPAPNVSGTVANGITTNNYFYNIPSPSHTNKYYGRLDYDLTQYNRATITDMESDSPSVSLGEGFCPINCSSGDGEYNQAQISDVWTLGTRSINEARMGFNFEFDFDVPSTVGLGFPSKLGWQFSHADNFPTISINGLGSALTTATNAVYKEMVFDPSDVVTLIRGKHVLRFGGEFLINRLDNTLWGNINSGTMTYTGAYTSGTGTSTNLNGVAYADFLLGDTNQWSASFTPEWGGRLKNPQLFAQDDIKLLSNLTVNLGVRWQGITGWKDEYGNALSFDPTVINPANNSPGAMWYESTHANGRTTLQAPIWNTFLPRVGFSLQIRNNTVIHGGFGMYGSTWSNDTYGSGQGEEQGGKGNEVDSSNGVYPVVLLDSSGNTNNQAPVGGLSVNSAYINPSTNPAAYNGSGVSISQGASGGEYFYNEYHTPVPMNEQWNFGIQRQIGANMMADVTYIGSHGWGLPFPGDINQIPESDLAAVAGGAPVSKYRPYPLFQDISGPTFNNISNYNAVEGVIRKRMSNGFTYSFNFTWEHFLDDQDTSGHTGQGGSQYVQNTYNPAQNYGNSDLDTPKMFKGYVVYQLPFGQGRRFLNNNILLDEIVGGWQTAGTLVLDSGQPFNPVMAVNNSFSQDGNQYPNVVANPFSGGSFKNVHSWYNVASYAAPPNGTYGDMQRDSIFGPDMTVLNLSLGKTFAIPGKEHSTFEVRADATNALNHPSFGQPDNTIGPGHVGQITTLTQSGRLMQIYGRLEF